MATAVASPTRLPVTDPAGSAAPAPAEQFRRSVSAPAPPAPASSSASSSASSYVLSQTSLPEDAALDGSGSPPRAGDDAGMPSRSEEYRLLFRLPPDELLVQDFNCAFQENILIQGHMYIFIRHVCFYSNIFGFETKKIISLQEVTAVRKAKTASIFPNAIEIFSGEKKYFFGSFLSRDEAYRVITDNWVQQNSDAKAFLERQDSKISGASEDAAYSSVEVSRELKQAEDASSSKRNSDAKISDTTVLNGIVENGSTSRASVIQENASSSSSLNPFTLQSLDADAPNVPENFVMLAEEKFPVPLEEFFTLFLSDSAGHLLDDFRRKCGDKEFNSTPWRPDDQSGLVRDISFLHPIKLYLGAKFGSCKEVQKLNLYRNSHIVIVTSQQISDAPYGDHFTVEGFWDIQQDTLTGNTCTLRIYLNVAFSKKTMFRGRIDQATKDECREVYALWIRLARDILNKKKSSELKGVAVVSRAPQLEAALTDVASELEPAITDSAKSVVSPVVTTRIDQQVDNALLDGAQVAPSVEPDTQRSSHTLVSYAGAIHFPQWLVLAVVGIVILMQVAVIIVLLRSPNVVVVSPEVALGGPSSAGKLGLEWVRSRLSVLGNEMRLVDAHMEMMRREQAWLQEHLERLERLAQIQDL